MTFNKKDLKRFAAIQYTGIAGITSHCLDAIARIIQCGDKINSAKLISYKDGHGGDHGFLFNVNIDVYVAVKAGFASGYGGEGPTGLSKALQLLERHGAEIEEYEVTQDLLERLNHSCLLRSDIEYLETECNIVRPFRWYDYILYRNTESFYDNHKLKHVFPVVVPFEIIDLRIIDLAIKLDTDPDSAIHSGYRRLEDTVRKRCNLNGESGSRLFSKAFQVNNSILYWEDDNGGEHNGKASLFTAVFNAYRNRRAHTEFESDKKEYLREFLLINELFLLELKAVVRPNEVMSEEIN